MITANTKEAAIFSARYIYYCRASFFLTILMIIISRYMQTMTETAADSFTLIISLSILLRYFVPKYEKYEVQLRKDKCKELFELLQAKVSEHSTSPFYNNFNSEVYFIEHFGSNNTFKYTEVIVYLNSLYKNCIDELKLNEKITIPYLNEIRTDNVKFQHQEKEKPNIRDQQILYVLSFLYLLWGGVIWVFVFFCL